MSQEPYILTDEEKEQIRYDVERSLRLTPQERYDFVMSLLPYAKAGQKHVADLEKKFQARQ